MYDAGEVIGELGLDRLEEGELAMFCGAGISVNSGIPAAWRMVSSILQTMRVDADDSKAIIESSIPFELFMETLDGNSDITPLLKVFQLGQPNNNHILIARLARLGLVKTIVTTNFDPHIENALAVEGVDYTVLSEEAEFEEVDNNIHSVVVVKLHGTVENPKSIRTTLRSVASSNLSERRRGVIKHVFSTGHHNKVLVLGYSCSDTDLVPQMQSLEDSKKEILFLKHEQKGGFELLALRGKAAAYRYQVSSSDSGREGLAKVLSALGGFPGVIVEGSTDALVSELASVYGVPLPTTIKQEGGAGFQSSVDSWAEPVRRKDHDLHIAGLLLTNLSKYDCAKKYLERELGASQARGDERGIAGCLGSIANVLRSVGDFEKAMEYHERARLIFHQLGDDYGEAGCYLNMGNALNEVGRFPEAFDCHERALSTFKHYEDLESMATCYAGHGDSYRLQNLPSGALEYYKKALEIKQIIGDVMGIAVCHGNLGTTYGDMGDSVKSEEEYRAARGFYESIDYWKGISNSDIGLANTLIEADRAEEALKLCEPVLSKNEQIGDRAGVATCHATIGAAYYALGDMDQAIYYLELSSQEFNATGQKEYELRANSLLKECYRRRER